jgi:quercetin dioxygenase-like cupin family protein
MDQVIVRQRAGENETLSLLGEQFTVLASAEETGSYEVFIQVVPAGGGPPLHAHPWDEAFYVLEGELVFRTNTQQVRAAAGAFVHFPAGVPHAFATSHGTAAVLSFTSRPGAAAFFRESFRTACKFPGDLAQLLAVAPRHHVQLLETTGSGLVRHGGP